jgi:hypothetical protein
MAKRSTAQARIDEDLRKDFDWALGHTGLGETQFLEACIKALVREVQEKGEITLPLAIVPKSRLTRPPPGEPVAGKGQRTAGQPPARTRAPEHGHGHGTPSVPQSMVPCDHGRSVAKDEDRFAGLSEEDLEAMLDSEGSHWEGQLPDIFGAPGDDFRLTWLKRFCDRWSGCAYRAIGEVKAMQMAGKPFSKGPGPYANFLFNKYRYAAKRRHAGSSTTIRTCPTT